MNEFDSEFLRACARKRRFRKAWHAEKALWNGVESNHYDIRHGVYNCKFCQGYHIGRKPIKAAEPEPEKLPLRLDGYLIAVVEDGYAFVQGTKNNHYKLLNLGWQPVEKDGEKLYRKKLPTDKKK
jgi:hypothetical protein